MTITDLIDSADYRQAMFHKLNYNDPYFHRLWMELRYFNERTESGQRRPLTQEQMLMVALLMLAQQRSELLEDSIRRYNRGMEVKLESSWYEEPPPLRVKTDEEKFKDFQALKKMGIDSFLKPVVSEGHVFACAEVPIEEHPMYKELLEKYKLWPDSFVAAAMTAEALGADDEPTPVINNTIMQTVATLMTEPDGLHGELDKCSRCGGSGYDPEDTGHDIGTGAPEPQACRECNGHGTHSALPKPAPLCAHGIGMDKHCPQCHNYYGEEPRNPRQG